MMRNVHSMVIFVVGLSWVALGCTDEGPVGTGDVGNIGADADLPSDIGDPPTDITGPMDVASEIDMAQTGDILDPTVDVPSDASIPEDLGDGIGVELDTVDATGPEPSDVIAVDIAEDGSSIVDAEGDSTTQVDSIGTDVVSTSDVGLDDIEIPEDDTGSIAEDISDPPVEDIVETEDTAGDPLDCEALIAGNTLDPYMSGCSDGSREGFLNAAAYPNLAACGGAWSVPGIHHPEPACNWEAGNDGVNPEGTGCNVTDICAAGWHVCLGKDDVLSHNPTGCDGLMDCAQSPAFFVVRTSSIGAFYCAPDTIGDPASENDLFGCGDLGCPTKQHVCQGNLSMNSQTKCTPDVPCTTCTGTQECLDGSACIEGPCYPLTLGSHNLCKGIKNKPTASCQCYFLGELDPSHPKYVEGDFETVICEPGSGGCGWCKPLDYFAKQMGLTFEDVWDCGTNSTKEALNVVKTNPYEQGGVLCCRDFN